VQTRSGVLIKLPATLGTRAKAVSLIDCGATGNFVSESFVKKCGLTPQECPLRVCLADGRTTESVGILHDVRVRIGTYAERMDLIVTPLQGYDIILGMAWLEEYNPPVDWRGKSLTLIDKKGQTHVLRCPSTGAAAWRPQPAPRTQGLNLITSKQLERQHHEGLIDFACLVYAQSPADMVESIRASALHSPPPPLAAAPPPAVQVDPPSNNSNKSFRLVSTTRSNDATVPHWHGTHMPPPRHVTWASPVGRGPPPSGSSPPNNVPAPIDCSAVPSGSLRIVRRR